MKTSAPLTLPPWKVVLALTEAQGGCTPASPVNMLAAYDHGWQGVPVGLRHLLQPVLFHRGSWLAWVGIDPEAVEPLPATTFFNSVLAPLYRQFGTAWGEAGNCTRPPQALLHHPGCNILSNYRKDRMHYVDDLLPALADVLAPRNVFCGGMYAGNFGNTNYLCGPFPGYLDAGFNYVVDEQRFEGGDLLFLSGTIFNGGVSVPDPFVTGAGSLSPYFEYKSYYDGDVNIVVYVPFSTNEDVIAQDLDALARGSSRFRRFKHIVYLRKRTGSYPAEVQPFDDSVSALEPGHLALNARANPYNVFIKGSYGYNEDITSIISQDIRDFFTT